MKKFRYILLLALLCFSFASAQPPFQQFSGDTGITIEASVIEIHKVNQDFFFNIHVHNSSNGLLLNNETTNCTIHLFRPIDGYHIVEDFMDFDVNGIDFDKTITSGNFTELGQYSVLFNCRVPGEIGGFLSYDFDVTSNGQTISTGSGILYSLFSLFLFVMICVVSFFIITLPYENEKDEGGFATKVVRLKYLRPLLVVALYLLTIILLNFLNGIAINFTVLSMFAGTLGFIFETMLRLSWPFTVIIIVWIIIMLVKDTNVNKQLDKFDKFDPFKKDNNGRF